MSFFSKLHKNIVQEQITAKVDLPAQSTKPEETETGGYFQGIILAIALAFGVILGAFFFAQTKITTAMFLTVNIFPLAKIFLTFDFVFFIIFASLAFAIIMLIGRKFGFKQALLFSIIGYAAGAAISIMLFNLYEFIIPLSFVVVGIPIGIRYLLKREEEVKYLKEMRAGASGVGRTITVACVLFTVVLLLGTYAQKDALQQSFVGEMLSMTVGGNTTLSDTFTGQLSDAIAAQQQQTVDTIIQTPEMASLQAKNDPDGVALAQRLNNMKQQFSATEFKQKMTNSLKSQNVDIGKELVTQFPMIQFMAEYAWLMYPLEALVIMLFIGGFLIKNISAVIYGALAKFI